MSETGKVWKFGDNINTDVLAPGLYMKGPLEQLAPHCLESIDPEFASNVRSGDVIVGGENFGIGSSREQAVQVLNLLGVRALVAKSFGGIFFRNALNFGIFALTCGSSEKISAGDQISIDPLAGLISNKTTGESYDCEKLPGNLFDMVMAGGLVEHLELKLKRTKALTK